MKNKYTSSTSEVMVMITCKAETSIESRPVDATLSNMNTNGSLSIIVDDQEATGS